MSTDGSVGAAGGTARGGFGSRTGLPWIILALVAAILAVAVLSARPGPAGAVPANDNRANATVIGTLPFNDTISTVGATKEAEETSVVDPNLVIIRPPCVTPEGAFDATVWYTFTFPVDATLIADTAGSSFNTFISVWRQQGTGGLAQVGCNDFYGSPVIQQARLVFAIWADTTYFVQIGGSGIGVSGTLVLSITSPEAPDPPTFTPPTNPPSPANNNNPKIKGSAEAGSTVQLYTDALCLTPIGAPTAAATFASPGIPVTVSNNTSTTFYATATTFVRSGCSTDSITYVEDSTPPQTTITLAPSDPSGSPNATFEFTSSESGSTFGCQIDGGGFSTCTSPKDYVGLAVTSHTFDVRATDAAGNTDPSPASYTWTIVPSVDTDGDGLLNSEETLHGCDSDLPDTDGDGLTDFQEVVLGSFCHITNSDGDTTNDVAEAFWAGTASGAAATSLTDSSQSWVTNQWAGYFLKITGGTGAGNPWVRVVSNTADTLTISADRLVGGVPWPAATPVSGDTYRIQKPGSDPADACADSTTPNNERGPLFGQRLSPWPHDLNDDRTVSGADVFALFPPWLAEVGDANYDPRLDVSLDGLISGNDVFGVFPLWLVNCSDVVQTVNGTVAQDRRVSTGGHTTVQSVAVTAGPASPPTVALNNGGPGGSGGWRATCNAAGSWTVQASVRDTASATTETRTYTVNCT